MTQAYNLAILANAVDSSGKLNVGTNSTGVLPVANGGTGTATPSLVAGTNISITGTFPNQTINNTSTASGTVTSVATGNGLQGGTITTSGTLSVACPTFNTVGSYCFAVVGNGFTQVSATAGSNYSVGGNSNQIQVATLAFNNDNGLPAISGGTGISGTWKYMGNTYGSGNNYNSAVAIACRVS